MNMNIKINNRLQKISDFIIGEDRVIDIGCDHGLLGIYLVINKNIKKMVSSDLNQLPLNKAKENLLNYDLINKIELRLGDGLECVSNDLDTVIISGMGGETINEILKDINKYPNIKKIVVSPNTDFSKTRKIISKLGFYLDKEDLVYEKKKYYLVSCYIKGKSKKIDYRFGKLNLSNEIVINYYKELVSTNKKIINNLTRKNLLKKIKLNLENYLILRKFKDLMED